VKPKYLEQSANHRDRWTISYVDVLTILLVFFIMAAAKNVPVHADPPPPPPPPPVQAAKMKSPLESTLDVLKEKGIEATMETRGLTISLPQAILFAPGDDRVSKDALPMLSEIAGVLNTLPNQVGVVGHADSSPIHNAKFKSNWELSGARGLRLLELLRDKCDVDEARLSVSSDGANRPLESNETPEGRAANRRVEIVILN
jgi:chemotaxis protein MotB